MKEVYIEMEQVTVALVTAVSICVHMYVCAGDMASFPPVPPKARGIQQNIEALGGRLLTVLVNSIHHHCPLFLSLKKINTKKLGRGLICS